MTILSFFSYCSLYFSNDYFWKKKFNFRPVLGSFSCASCRLWVSPSDCLFWSFHQVDSTPECAHSGHSRGERAAQERQLPSQGLSVWLTHKFHNELFENEWDLCSTNSTTRCSRGRRRKLCLIRKCRVCSMRWAVELKVKRIIFSENW